MNKIIKLTAVLFLIISVSSCKKFLDVKPVGKVIPTTVEDFRALLTSAYSVFPRHKSLLATRTDELVLNEDVSEIENYRDIYKWNDNNPDAITFQFPYVTFYNAIFNANSVIADVESKAGVSPETAQIKGEAYLLRAYSHFELLNLYAKPYNKATAGTDVGVPISTKIDLEQNYKPATTEAVYAQIFADIAEGKKLLNVATFDAGKNYRFTTRAALALEARIYEFRGEFSNALAKAQELLAVNNQLEDLNVAGSPLPNSYLSKESIMSMEDAFNVSISNSSLISAHLLSIYDRANDLRFAKNFSGSGSRYVSLKGGNAALKVSFRNGEIYLIQAEAALQTDNMPLALQSLLALKVKRLKPAYYTTEAARISGLDKPALLQEILNERERELALEGHRWYDLRRYGQPSITHTLEGVTYILQKNDPRYTIRFPKDALSSNPNL